MTFTNKVFLIVWLSLMFSSCSDSTSNISGKVEQFYFQDVSRSANLKYTLTPEVALDRDKEGGGIAVDDVNGDGYLDFFVTHGVNGAGKLFINQRDGTFLDRTLISNIVSSSKARAAFFIDLNDDRYNDLVITEAYPLPLKIFISEGDGTFTQSVDDFGLNPAGNTFSMTAADYDKDDDLDLAIAQYFIRPNSGVFESWLWENNEGIFNDVTASLPIPTQAFRAVPEDAEDYQWNFAFNFSDIDGDGYLDILSAANYQNSIIYKNNSGTSFSVHDAGIFTDEAGMGVAIGDYDNDGDFDWFVSSIYHPDTNFDFSSTGNSGNRLYQNDGAGNFSDATDEAGVRIGHFGWGACFKDFDNDGDLDIFHATGFGDEETPFGSGYLYFKEDPAIFFTNNGQGIFEEEASRLGIKHTGQGRGISCFDFDNDGDLDILIANNGASPTLYENKLSIKNNYIGIKLTGVDGNHQGVGAKITLISDGETQIREIYSGSNYLSNNPLIAHFGLAKAESITSINVQWNDSLNLETELTDIQINQTLVISHPNI